MVETPIKNISYLIENPKKVSDQELNYLFNLTKKYPYSVVCFIIVAKIIKYQKRTGFSTIIKSAAIRSNNRTQLLDLVNNNFTNKTDNLKSNNEELNKIDFTATTKPKKNKDDVILETNIFNNIVGDHFTKEIEEVSPKTVKGKDENKIDNYSKLTFENWLYKNQTKKISIKERSVDDILKSLEDRVKNNTKSRFFSAETTAKKSLEDNPIMNTETLAEIYVKQGNYPKAIKIYEELMLSIPEKKLFFASRINYINSKTKL
tara:strand:+ start:9790 stop:10572 length:783 start_codon:yes stop_codon:yes gene_type:complete